MVRALRVVLWVSFLVTSEIASRATLGIGVLLVAGLLEPGVFGSVLFSHRIGVKLRLHHRLH